MEGELPFVFSEDEVESLNAYQDAGVMHPFTCGNCSGHRDLIATREGWHCPDCDYRQDWAHLEMKNWQWLLLAWNPLSPDLERKRDVLLQQYAEGINRPTA